MAQNQTDYSNVPVATGLPPEKPEHAGFFQPPVPAAEGVLATDQARAVAEVQAALVIAASRPRNELRARDRLLQACQRVNLAAGALYQYGRGGTGISGPSIRLAEAAARAWGNMTYGFRELTRGPGLSECEAYAWDLETNTKAVRQFTVRHRRDTRKGGYDVTEERDVYELMANQAQRRVRSAILEIIPGDIIEDAVAECERTQKATVGNVAEAAARLVEAFADMGIPREAVEKRLGHRIEAIQPAQIIAFRKIYTSIKDGMSEPKDWFELPASMPAANEQEAAPAEKGESGRSSAPEKRAAEKRQPAGRRRETASAVAPARESGLKTQSVREESAPAEAEEGRPEPQGPVQISHDQHSGEVFGPAAGLVACPKNGKQVDELECVGKPCHDGCPEFM